MLRKNRFIGAALLALLISGCTVDKKIYDMIARIEKRLDIIEKIVLPPKEDAQQSAFNIPVAKSPILGKADAKNSIIVFTNYQCQFCARADAMLREALKDKDLKEEVNLVFKHFPFDRHHMARPASKAAMAAQEQGKFWDMTEIIFANQKDLSPENIQVWAQKIGLDMNKFNADLKANDEKYELQIKEDMKLGEEAQLQGTPLILIGGWPFDPAKIDAASIKAFIKAKGL
jgi:protein-disulfide isomerase